MEQFVLLLSPFAPHIAEELWQALGHDETLAYEPWPTYDESLLVEDEMEIPVQINGKVRAKITVPADADQAKIEDTARHRRRSGRASERQTVGENYCRSRTAGQFCRQGIRTETPADDVSLVVP